MRRHPHLIRKVRTKHRRNHGGCELQLDRRLPDHFPITGPLPISSAEGI
jgi:hypothetical protein